MEHFGIEQRKEHNYESKTCRFKQISRFRIVMGNILLASNNIIISNNFVLVGGLATGTFDFITDSSNDYLLDEDNSFLTEGGETFIPAIGYVSTTIITSGTVSSRDWHGRASLLELNNGNWVLIYRSAPAHDDNGNEVLRIRFSNDKGATWTSEDTKLGGGAVDGFPMTPPGGGTGSSEGPGEPWLYYASNGNLILHMWKVDYGIGASGTYQSISSDNGETWSTPSQIDFSGIGDDAKIFATDDHFILDNIIYAAARQYDDAVPTNVKSIFIKSEDNGITWEYISDISNFTNDTTEVGFEYLGSNIIIAILRDQGNAVTYKSISIDLGNTWSDLEDIASEIQASGRHRIYTLAHLKSEDNWWEDNILIMIGFELANPGNSHPRVNSIWISENAGSSWYGPFYLDKEYEDGGYGDILYDSTNDELVYITNRGTLSASELIQYRLKLYGVG